jgi:hypothetical protein
VGELLKRKENRGIKNWGKEMVEEEGEGEGKRCTMTV